MAHNSRKPADAKVVKPLTNLTEVRTKHKVLQVRFLGQNLAPKLKEVGLLNSVNLSARSTLQTWRKERAANSQPSQAPAPPTTGAYSNIRPPTPLNFGLEFESCFDAPDEIKYGLVFQSLSVWAIPGIQDFWRGT